jgi:hypothetical protein
MITLRNMRRKEHVACKGEKRNEYRILEGNSDGKRQLVRPRIRWEDNIKMHIREVGWGGKDRINLVQDMDQ